MSSGSSASMLFRGSSTRTDTEYHPTGWRVATASAGLRATAKSSVCWVRTIRVLLVILACLLILILYRAKDVWPEMTLIPANRSDWVDPALVAIDPGLDPLPRVTVETFFDIEMDGEYIGRIVMGLFGEAVPNTVKNFRDLCSGELGPNLHYKNMRFHRIIPGFIVQGGDIRKGDGTGSVSIYGSTFDDEPAGLALKHDRPYLLQMANSGPNTNGSQFCFMLGAAPHLNGHHVVFGRVLSGFDVVDKMGIAGGDGELPTKHVVVVDCGIVKPPS